MIIEPFGPTRVFALVFSVIGFSVMSKAVKHNPDLYHLFFAYLFMMVGSLVALAEAGSGSKALTLAKHITGIMLPGFFLAAAAFRVSKIK